MKGQRRVRQYVVSACPRRDRSQVSRYEGVNVNLGLEVVLVVVEFLGGMGEPVGAQRAAPDRGDQGADRLRCSSQAVTVAGRLTTENDRPTRA